MDRYRVLDLVQESVSGSVGRAGTKRFVDETLRSFFMHNRAELPRDKSFRVKGDRPRVVGSLSVDELRRILDSCDEVYRAVFLCMFQGGMGVGELLHWRATGWESLRDQLSRRAHPVRIDLPGRKRTRNNRPFYTFIGQDAAEALRNWLRVRPPGSPYIFVNQFRRPLSDHGLRQYWTHRLIRLARARTRRP